MSLLPQLVTPKPKFSNFNLSKKTRTSIAPGALYPMYIKKCLPGDRIKISLKSLLKTVPLKAPLMGKFTLQADWFFCPHRLYVPEMQTNSTDFTAYTGGNDINFPYFTMPVDLRYAAMSQVPTGVDFNSQLDGTSYWKSVHPEMYPKKDKDGNITYDTAVYGKYGLASTCLLNYLGFPSQFIEYYTSSDVAAQKYNALPLLAYLDIYRHYYVNPQEKNYYVCEGVPDGSPVNQLASLGVKAYGLQDLNNFFEQVRSYSSNFWDVYGGDVRAYTATYCKGAYAAFSGALDGSVNNVVSKYIPMRGLFCRTYKPDYFNAFLNNTTYGAIETATKVAVQNGGITINQIRLGNKLQKLAERSIISGTRYAEFIRATFGINTNQHMDQPEFLGSQQTALTFEDVVSQTDNRDDANDTGALLGELAGRGVSFGSGRNNYVNISEYGYLMCIVSLVPSVDYCEGLSKDMQEIKFSDLYNPSLDRLGFQPIRESEVYANPVMARPSYDSSTGYWESDDMKQFSDWKNSIGYLPAWSDYMTDWNTLHGEFADTLKFWTLSRRHHWVSSGNATPLNFLNTTYIFPADYNYAFADADPGAQNFYLQMSFDVKASRAIGKRLMPNLG